MSYLELTAEQYAGMPMECRVFELAKWIADCLENQMAVMRSIAGTSMESDPEIENVIATPFNDLGMMINDYEEDSACHFLLKYRLEHHSEDCDERILDTNEYGKLSCEYARDSDQEEDIRDIQNIRNYCHDLILLCRIFGLPELEERLQAWCP